MTQKEALDILKTGANAFITGEAGSGKTHLLREYIEYLRRRNVPVGVTASTGIAATHMNGMTIHAWCGMGIRDTMTESDVAQLVKKRYLRDRVMDAKVLVIDEVSMLHASQLDLVDQILRGFREAHLPFGGLQVVLCGDFFQLPPVGGVGGEAYFAYRSRAWHSLSLKVCYLNEQHRQADSAFLGLLNAVRRNSVTHEMIQLLKTRLADKPEGSEITRLYTHNFDVDAQNEKELAKLAGASVEYEMYERGPAKLCETLKKGCLAPQVLKLKKGARVMFVKNNFEEGYVNGTLGTVLECDRNRIVVKTLSGKTIEAVRTSWRVEDEGDAIAELTQYPLRLAWAITIHKSQGMSLDAAVVNLTNSFERGMGYVALSRLTSLEGLSLLGMNKMSLLVNEEVLEVDEELRRISARDAAWVNSIQADNLRAMQDAFAPPAAGPSEKKKKLGREEETKILIQQGYSVREVAERRGLTYQTILKHLEKIMAGDLFFDISHLKREISDERLARILDAYRAIGPREDGLYIAGPIKTYLGADFSYEEIHLARLFLKGEYLNETINDPHDRD